MKFNGFVGPSYTLNSVNIDCQRCVNLYPEVIESGTGKEAQVAYLKSTPGLELLFTVGTGPIRLIHVDTPTISIWNPENRIFIVSGNTLYKASFDGTTWTTEAFATTFATSTGPVRAVSLNTNLGMVVFVDGDDTYLYWKYDSGDALIVEDFDTFSSFGFPVVPNATHVVLLDGYLIYNEGSTGRFQVSDWNSLAVNPLNFASSEGDLDNIVAIIENNRDLWIFNERSTEVFSNTGNADFPFERIGGGFIEKGCVAPFSVAKIDGVIFWLGRDKFGEGIVYAANSLNPQRISTHAVEQAIQGYADISSATAYTYQSGGHSFYVLNFAGMTWVYDFSTKLWHERAYTSAGNLVRHLGECHDFFPEYSLHLVGDYSTGKVYKFNDSYYTDNTDAITRMRTLPHLSAGLKRVFCSSFQIDMETGVGLSSGQGSDPQVVLDFSDDGGHTWSSESWATAGGQVGGIGEYKTRVIFRRLGKFRDRVFRIKITDPVKVVLLGAELEVRQGTN